MKSLCLLLSFFISLQSFCQKSNYVQQEWLIQLKENAKPDEVLNQVNFKKEAAQVVVQKQLSTVANIWLLRSVEENDEWVKDWLLSSSEVLHVQRNHITTRRNAPNDPMYTQQWHLKNTGQNGGVIGADIKAEQAWDLATGGNTTQNDEIVLCVIDDGIDENHPDFAGNIWVNKHEIPNNGIDDDNNGYIDDYKGWNTFTDNDKLLDFPSGNYGSHGSQVAGMLGAVGNNGTGVSGINWKAKIMVVLGDTPESRAIESYEYPLKMRKLYNETNGAKGAFVVATNTSWGIDNAFPADAPIWCGFYDLLGKEGILNAGATINANINIDLEGDIPSTCPSDYFIGVTNTTNKDKLANAGYGEQHIDIGAPGEKVTLTTNNESYGSFSGTSFATPAVVGALGLMYNFANNQFIQLSKDNPAEAAGRMKFALLAAADKIPALTNKTVTGGRLNLFECLQEVVKQQWIISSIDDSSEKAKAVVYPNPGRGSLNLIVEEGQFYTIRVLDLSGRSVFEGTDYKGNQSLLYAFESGVYFIELTYENGKIEVLKWSVE